MKNKSEKLLPKIMTAARGTVHTEYKRCGKLNCRCRTRNELHGAYFYHFVRVNGTLTKRYLRPDEADLMRAACAARQKREREHRAAVRLGRESWRELLAALRQLLR